MSQPHKTELVALVASRCHCTEAAAVNLLDWVGRHSTAYHGGQPDDCDQCKEMIRLFGPMPAGELILTAESISLSHRRKHSGNYQKQQIPRRLRAAILQRDGSVCRCCGATTDLTVDHILPERRGGTLDPSNLQILCRSCNSKKHTAISD